jgi:D-sedoheptulose 7-phosphate isomerase
MGISNLIHERVAAIREMHLHESSYEVERLEVLASKILGVFQSGGKIAFVGNGGSAAEAMHLAAEFTGKCVIQHKPLPALCLNESQSALTAIANDFGSEFMFSRQVEAHLVQGDLLIALSTSGKSSNILRALDSAIQKRVSPILWMGNFDVELDDIDVWKVPSTSTPRIQEIHLAWGHILAEAIESEL